MVAVTFVILALLGVGIYKAFTLQILDREHLLNVAEQNYLRTMVVEERRGEIVDRRGQLLATSVKVDTIVANPREVRDPVATAKALVSVLGGLDEAKLTQKLSSKSWWIHIKRRVSEQESAAVRALRLPGILITQEWKRYYPKRELAGQLIGRVGADALGLEGLEKALEKTLVTRPEPPEPETTQTETAVAEKTPGSSSKPAVKPPVATIKVPYIKDIKGRTAYVEGIPADLAPEGYSVELTIDAEIQSAAEEALKKGVVAHNAQSGIAIVMNVETGEILALANYPEFNPNSPGNHDTYAWKNRALKDQYEPGSTFKVFSMAAVLDRKAARLNEKINTENGVMRVGKYLIRDTHRAKEMTVREVLGHSSNIGITKLTQRIGKKNLHSMLKSFGFGERTGIVSDYEAPGSIQPLKLWADITFANVSFGQGIAVTPLQMVRAVAAIGNEGKLMRPQILRRILTRDGHTVREFVPEVVGQTIRPDVAPLVIDAMKACVEPGGTGTAAAIPGYTVAGKTGTAQKADSPFRKGKRIANKTKSKGYMPDAWIASFVGLVPAENPQLAILVIVDEPDGRGFGGVVAAPVFREIGEFALKHLQIQKSVARPVKIANKGELEQRPAPALPNIGLADAVMEQPFATIMQGDQPQTVPNFVGQSIAAVVRTALTAGIQVEIEGTGRAVAQNPSPGTKLDGSERIRVRFESAINRELPNQSASAQGGL
ncbi:MAG: transpeptidase family protein [Myxococcales bacterium]|nr:transpeptidase family protein [Myxococcales bacterium]